MCLCASFHLLNTLSDFDVTWYRLMPLDNRRLAVSFPTVSDNIMADARICEAGVTLAPFELGV